VREAVSIGGSSHARLGLCSFRSGRDRKGGVVAYPFVESPNKTPTKGRSIDFVVMHTMEIAERKDAAEICAQWFKSRVSQVSAHYCVDADGVIQCVREKDIAWHARGGNTPSIGVELAGFARQTRKDWADAYSKAVLRRAATLVADVCRRKRIPVRWLVASDLLAGRRGITGHVEVSRAYRLSDHWDPGPGFPIEDFLARVRASQAASARARARARRRTPPAV
jgi:N-acetyl-anhydromuramyl-L-alanine amidase AmpD